MAARLKCSREAVCDTVSYREGRVWLVGAGPGDSGLFTQKGESVLAEAEVVVYDSLVGQEVLSRMPAGAEIIDAGKRAGNHHKSQWQTNEILAEEALKGKRVVRLKGGDPFLFGRGGEELELLTKYGIPYEVVPGVTSAISVPAYNGIPVTHRDFASSVHIITGHRRAGVGYDINFRALVEAGGTYVFLMGLAALGDLMRGLLDGGISPDMPAAVLQQGATSRQRKVLATVATIEEAVAQAHLKAPAVIVVGEVCALAQDFSWYERLPLFGEKIVVTRPRRRSAALVNELKKLGAEVVSAPVIQTVPVTEKGKLEDIEKAFREIGKYTMLVFTSPYGVERFMELCREHHVDLRALAGKRLAAIGKATAEAIEKRGMFVDIIPEQYESAKLGKAIRKVCRPGETILIPRSSIGSQALVDEIMQGDGVQLAGTVPIQFEANDGVDDGPERKDGIRVHDLPIYDTVCDVGTAAFLQKEMEAGDVTLVTFTSASTVRGFAAMLPDYDYRNITAVCIGKQTEAAAASCGMKTVTAKNATVEDMTDCILSYHEKKFSD
ncbi:MAG: uroporphyrinogen-III C-methyltransferase [Clostridiales bacterium]|nr:uroporphyrinogen-III C-methyltransferase [Clostridiales bacterium]